MPDLSGMQKRNYALVARWGAFGVLVRGTAKRAAMMGMQEYGPKDRGLYADGAVQMVIPAYNLTVPPDRDLDLIEWKGDRYRIVGPITGPRPNGTIMHYKVPALWLEKV